MMPVSLEGGMSRTPKIDRARRNALKAASLVLGAFLATGALHRQASAAPAATATATATAAQRQRRQRQRQRQRQRYGNNQGRQLLCAGHANPDARGLSADRNLGSGRRGCGAFRGLRADQGNGQSHLEQRVGQMGRQRRICRFSYGAVLWVRTRRTQIFASRLCMPSTLMVS